MQIMIHLLHNTYFLPLLKQNDYYLKVKIFT